MRRDRNFQSMCGAALFLALGSLAANAQDLTYAISAPITSTDPHFQNATPNNAALGSIFEPLVILTGDGQLVPGLAESWTNVDDLTWEFKLRDVTFHDGSPLTAEDVIYSLERPGNIESPAPYTPYTKAITEMEAVDDKTVRLKTATPYPLLTLDLSRVYIVSKAVAEANDTQAMNLGNGVIGTGPYEFVSFTADEQLSLARSDDYWGEAPAWENVQVRVIADDAARTTALLSGGVDAIENVPTPDVERMREEDGINFESGKSQRFVFLFLDSGRDEPPGVLGNDGAPLSENPFKDARVRQAVNLAIDRQAIAERVMMGLAYPSNNIVFDDGEGFIPGLENPPYDPEKAKALLAEAGYSDGFGITIASPNNRMINDEKVVQAIAQMLTRVGIRTEVDAMPFSVIASRGQTGDFGVSMMSWGSTTEASTPIRQMIACKDADKGWGAVNWGNYCNEEADALLTKALATVDTAARTKILEEAVGMLMDDVAIVPLYFQGSTWAAREGIEITPRSDERTSPDMFSPAT
jgi:peptide/nickel transport system substrate-binding protein